MALAACAECGKEISTGAKACPHCGAAGPAAGSGCLASTGKAVLGLVIFVVVLIFIGAAFESKPGPPTPADRTIGRAQVAARALKGGSLNPDRFVLERAPINYAADIICLEFRTENDFGGMTRDRVMVNNNSQVITSDSLDFDAQWQSQCEGPGVDDLAGGLRFVL
jgi:hypothetical protein